MGSEKGMGYREKKFSKWVKGGCPQGTGKEVFKTDNRPQKLRLPANDWSVSRILVVQR